MGIKEKVEEKVTKRIVLDSWAIIEWLDGEPPGIIVQILLDASETKGTLPDSLKKILGSATDHVELFMSLINLGEVFYRTGRIHGKPKAEEIWEMIKTSPLEIVPADESITCKAASIKMQYPMAYADAFACATSMTLDATLATGDPELKHFREVPILWLPDK